VLDAGGAGVRCERALAVVVPAHAHSERIVAEHLLDRSGARRLPDALALDHQTVALTDLHGSPIPCRDGIAWADTLPVMTTMPGA